MADRNKKGQFQKGNPGKPKGAVNKVTSNLREKLTAAADNFGLIDTLFNDLAELAPLDRVRAITALLPYMMPKLQSIEMKEQTTLEQFISMSPDDRRAMIAQLKREIANDG